jgi:hypothetical protein
MLLASERLLVAASKSLSVRPACIETPLCLVLVVTFTPPRHRRRRERRDDKQKEENQRSELGDSVEVVRKGQGAIERGFKALDQGSRETSQICLEAFVGSCTLNSAPDTSLPPKSKPSLLPSPSSRLPRLCSMDPPQL